MDPDTPLTRSNQRLEDLLREGSTALKHNYMPESINDEENRRTPQPSPSKTKRSRGTNEAQLDEENSLPDTVTRRRSKTKKGESYARGDVYAALLEQVVIGAPDTFRVAFSAFMPARKFYKEEDSAIQPSSVRRSLLLHYRSSSRHRSFTTISPLSSSPD